LWTMLLVAIAVGTALAWGVARLVYSQLDLLPEVPPEPFLVVPVMAIAVLGGAVIVAACVGALFVQRAADRANVAEVLRVAG
ncbi:MAG: hypothetical protein M3124_06570, partial [Actinomycetota bacterium]|nr:hypothetical protein [Actinomycetota bacterium]